MTITHLAHTMDYNSKHSYVHSREALRQARKIKDPRIQSLIHNLEHSAKHAKDTVDHAKKLQAHLKKYPGAAAIQSELTNAPVDSPLPLKQITKRGKTNGKNVNSNK
jgi:hypothetical protein